MNDWTHPWLMSVATYLLLLVRTYYRMAEEIRQYMAELGYRKFDDMVGQVQHLEMNPDVLHYKSQVGR